MSIIKVPLLFTGSKGDKILYTLFDPGATFSCITPANAEYIGNIENYSSRLKWAPPATDII